jgi:molybdopterin-synthase adenylyltransferase
VTPNDDQQDRAGPADSVHHEARLTDRRPGPASAPGRRRPPEEEEDTLEKPRIKRTRELLESAGDIFILQPADGSDLRIEQPDDETRALLRALDGTRSVAELRQRFGSERVTGALAQLSEIGLLDDADDDARVTARERARYDRQLRYFSDLASGDAAPSDHQRRLREARVLMLGLGGLGSWASYALACCGIGELVLLDHDRVEPSNFNRQVLYRERDIGRLKAECAKEAIAAFDSSCRLAAVARRLESAADVAEAVDGMDFVVASADWPAHDIERWVNAACFELGVPFISMSHSPPVARVGPLYAPGATGCFECQEATYREGFPLYDELVEQRRGRTSQAATLGPVCAFVGGQVALETIHQLTGICPPATLGASHVYDLRTMSVSREEVPRVPGCAVCGA